MVVHKSHAVLRINSVQETFTLGMGKTQRHKAMCGGRIANYEKGHFHPET